MERHAHNRKRSSLRETLPTHIERYGRIMEFGAYGHGTVNETVGDPARFQADQTSGLTASRDLRFRGVLVSLLNMLGWPSTLLAHRVSTRQA